MHVEGMGGVQAAVLGMVLLHGAAQWFLESVNRRYLDHDMESLPERLRQAQDEATRAKTLRYQSARSRFEQWNILYGTAVLTAVVFSGFLPWAFEHMTGGEGGSVWTVALFILSVLLAVSVMEWPFDYYQAFVLEQRFGFNTSTPGLWWWDKAKGTLLSVALGWPLLAGVVSLTEWAPRGWWLLGWGLIFGVQLLMVVLAPRFIMPLFNKFSPLPEGTLKDRLLSLAKRTSFSMGQILVMDGSRRSRHSNAFFTGFGRTRRVVLYDTLTDQLAEPEVESVVAHEIGHAKLGHIPKMILMSALGLLAGFLVIHTLSYAPWFSGAFGFEGGGPAVTLLLCALLSGPVLFWLHPLLNGGSRAREFEADAYAARWTEGSAPLIGALIQLNESNLSQLTPHPWYRRFYYSHPTLAERVRALETGSSAEGEGGVGRARGR